MLTFFKVASHVAYAVHSVLPYRVYPENHFFLQQRLRNRFEHLVRDGRWQAIASLMHFSPDSFFRRINAELAFLTQNKEVNEIDLLDLVFLSNEHAIIRSYITRHAIPCTQATLEKAILCNSVKGIEFLAKQGAPLTINDLDFAASNGRFACVQYLVGRGIYPDNGTLDRCVLSTSHMPTIRYLVEQCGIEPTEGNVNSSIMGGQHLANRYLRARINQVAESNSNNANVLKG